MSLSRHIKTCGSYWRKALTNEINSVIAGQKTIIGSSKPHILPVIIIAQFFCTSLWFVGNAILNDLIISFNLTQSNVGYLTSAVQFGFITGTLIFAILSIADRFAPSKVFLVSALCGAVFNLGCIWLGKDLESILASRFLTGFCLAGIYPVGMKIAADYYEKGLGKSLGYLVGALVFGTALPFLFIGLDWDLGWKNTLVFTSVLSIIGGILMVLFVPEGPYRKAAAATKLNSAFTVFKEQTFRKAALSYFGHMWELYTFWALLPLVIDHFAKTSSIDLPTHLLTFLIISLGGLGCIFGGYTSSKIGPPKVAFLALCFSGLCCLSAYFVFISQSLVLFILLMSIWGIFVIMDSPMISTLVAQNAPADNRGTALTIVNCIGFGLTIVSIQVIVYIMEIIGIEYIYFLLAIGPIIGISQLYSIIQSKPQS